MNNLERYTNVMQTIRSCKEALIEILADEAQQNKILKEFAPKSEVSSLTGDGKIIYTQIRDLETVFSNRITI